MTVAPMPPVATGAMPWVGAGLRLLRAPAAFFAATRAALGETFLVDAFGFRLFCVFSPAGVRRLYALAEDEASFGLATFRLLTLKIPPELLTGRRNGPRTLFANPDVERYLGNLAEAVGSEVAQLGPSGRFEVFREMRRLGHRLGLASWIGPEAVTPRHLDRLIPLLDRLDSADAFVRPSRAFVTLATRYAVERRALRVLERIVTRIRTERRRSNAEEGMLEQIAASYADLAPAARDVAVARDVIMLHLGAQSNLYAALAWTLINVVTRPAILAAVRDGDDVLLEQCVNESIRLAQRSITLRQVMRPIEVADEHQTYRIAPGVLVTTMLSVGNTSAASGLETFDPAHYDGRRLAAGIPLPARELVSTFGHGGHSCPAQRFAISAIRMAVRRLVERYDITPEFADAQPRVRQLGAVARVACPCVVAYRLHAVRLVHRPPVLLSAPAPRRSRLSQKHRPEAACHQRFREARLHGDGADRDAGDDGLEL